MGGSRFSSRRNQQKRRWCSIEHWVAPVFLAEAFVGEPANLEPDKHTDLGWFALDALPSPLTVAAQTAARALRGD